MSAHRERGQLLLQQNRPEQALGEFAQALREDPNDALAHALMALCLASTGKLDEGERTAGVAISMEPDSPAGHHVLGHIQLARNRPREAERSLREAVRLDPETPHRYASLSQALFAQRRWDEARQTAEDGLRVDAQDVDCLNARARALSQLGQDDVARRDFEAALARDPEDAETHANAGWAALRDGDQPRALAHFKESLRLDPGLDDARAGIVETLKARNFLYAILLKYFFWMGRLSPRGQWGVVIGGYVAFRLLRGLGKAQPHLMPWITPALIAYGVWVFLTWTGDAISSLLLRLHPYGRLALDREQIVASNFVGLTMLGAVAGFGWYFASGNDAALLAGVGFLLLTLPVSGVFSTHAGWPRRAMAAYTLALAGIGVAAATAYLGGGSAFNALAVAFAIGVLASGWVANGLGMARPKR